MGAFDSWESYFYPPPHADTLRNLPGILDPRELAQFEYTAVAARQRLLAMDPSLANGLFDAAHVRRLHRYLFQDMYEWAGDCRTQNMAARDFADVTTGEIDAYLTDVHRVVSATDWRRLGYEAFAERAALVFALLNNRTRSERATGGRPKRS